MNPADHDDAGFLSRWSRRKVQARSGEAPPAAADTEERAPAQIAPHGPPSALPPTSTGAQQATHATAGTAHALPAAPADGPVQSVKPPAPTLADVAQLTRESDFARFVAPGVDGDVKNAALKKLFGDPHFNVMDGLDTYIDDYGKPDPLPASSIRQMAQAAFLGLLEPAPDEAAAAAAQAQPIAVDEAPAQTARQSVPSTPAPDENADLRLQSHDAAGRGGAQASAAADGVGEP